MSNRTKVAILFGGRSAEHEVSVRSARNLIQAIDKEKYEILPIAVDRSGRWFLDEADQPIEAGRDFGSMGPGEAKCPVALVSGKGSPFLVALSDYRVLGAVDVVFPVLHGPFGEDGAVQGILKSANVPFVGAGVLGSAVGMDKDVTKRLLRDAGLPVARFIALDRSASQGIGFDEVRAQLGSPVFVKPANLGSSVGVAKVRGPEELAHALDDAFQFDEKALIEEYIEGREIECAILGNDRPLASVLGEVAPNDEFYSYRAKYLDDNGAVLKVPAELPAALAARIREMAVKTFQTLCCEGMARVDFFVKSAGEVYVNELNSIPGFTDVSMYPRLWQASGISYPELIDRLIGLALERFERESRLKTSLAKK